MKKNSDEKEIKCKKFFNVKRWVINICLITVFVLIIKIFFVQTVIVPSVFMEGTIHKGDFLLINKAAYKIQTPERLPLINRKFRKRILYNSSAPQIGDVLYLKLGKGNIYNLDYLLSRCVGLPGDTIYISNKSLYINGKLRKFSGNIEHTRNYSIPFGVEEKDFYFNNQGWNQDNFGPLIVPKAGQRINLTLKNIEFWKKFIYQDDSHNKVDIKNNQIHINDVYTKSYKVKNDYYFALGDNRELAIDSRYIGYISEKSIVGKAEMIYWSVNNYNSSKKISFSPGSIRWERLFNIVY